jgi:hypothetical protein
MMLSLIDRVLSTQSQGRFLARAHTRPCGRLDSHNRRRLSGPLITHRRAYITAICKAASTEVSGLSHDEQAETQTATEDAAAQEDATVDELEDVEEAEEDEEEFIHEGLFNLGVDTLFQVLPTDMDMHNSSRALAHLLHDRSRIMPRSKSELPACRPG